jgi:hypothetical protein
MATEVEQKARAIRAFHERFLGSDAEAVAVRKQLDRLYPTLATAESPTFRDQEPEELEGWLADMAEVMTTSEPLRSAPESVRTVPAFVLTEDYVGGTKATGLEWQSIFGPFEFDEVNGPEGILGDMKASGDAPPGVFMIGENVFVDTAGELGDRSRGAVYRAIGFAIEDGEKIAPSVSAFLAACDPTAGSGESDAD